MRKIFERFERIDRQFTAIFLAVFVMQTSIVAYARSIDYVPEQPPPDQYVVQVPFNIYLPPPRIIDMPAPPKVATPPARNTALQKPARRALRSRGLVGVIGALRKSGGALEDIFDEERVVPSIESALRGARGLDVATPGALSTRGDLGGDGSVELEEIALDYAPEGQPGEVGEKRETAIEVETEDPVVDGPISETEISRVMKRNLRAMRDCYEHALKRDPSLEGKVVLRFMIEDSGRVDELDVDGESLKSASLASCISHRSKAWRFPKPDGELVSVTYPILFTRAGN